jgi:hypothetical protein
VPHPLFARLALGGALLLAGPLLAAAAQAADPAPPTTYQLTPAQKAELAAASDEKKADPAADGLGGARHRAVHGEVGAMIGTGGARSLFGTAAIPIGEDGGAILSFENSRFGTIR